MSATNVIRFIGPSTAISVGAVSTTAVTIVPTGNETMNFCSFLNTGLTVITVSIAPIAPAPAAVIPTGATVSQTFQLPASMIEYAIVAVPSSFSVAMIGSGAGPSIVYVNPVGTQS